MALTKTPIELSSTPSIVDGGNATAITIDSSENVMVEKTSSDTATVGHELRINGVVTHTSGAVPTLYLNRTTSDGEIAVFRKDNTTVGSIAVASGNNLAIDGLVASHAGLEFGTGRITPRVAGATADNAVDLGYSTQRFQDLYLSGGAYLGGTGAANKLEDYEEGTFYVTFANSSGNMTATNLSFNSTANYVKVGELVFVHGAMATQGTLGGSGGAAVLLTGFPFSFANSTYIKIYVDDSGSYAKPSVAPTSIEIIAATTQGRIKTSSNVYQTNMAQSELAQSGNANRFYFNGVYRTTA